MGFVGEASERLERFHSFIYGFFEITPEQRTVDIAFESFYQRVSGGPGNELHIEVEAGRRQQPRQSLDSRTGLAALDAGDDGLRGSGSAGEFALSEAGPRSRLSKYRQPLIDSVHAIMIVK
jgi:hypothetical protein